MASGVVTQTPKMSKSERQAKKFNAAASNAEASAAKEGEEGEGKGMFPDPYAGRRWIPRWVSVPLQVAALGIIIYGRVTAIEERAAEVRQQEEDEARDEEAAAVRDGFDYSSDFSTTEGGGGIAESVGAAMKHMRTANTKANNGEFDKAWRHVSDAEKWDETVHLRKNNKKNRKSSSNKNDGGDADADTYAWLDSTYCTIEKRAADGLSREEFEAVYLEKKPVVLIGATDTTKFAAAVQKAALLQRYGNHSVTLSSANKNSYAKQEAQLLYYVDEMMSKPQTLTALGNETWYHFGDNKHSEWADIFALYEQPRKYIYGPYASMSFGLGASGSGVPFHTHGHVFAEVFNGRKRWWLSPPRAEPLFGPDETSISWLDEVYPRMMTQEDSAMPEGPEKERLRGLVAKHTKKAEAKAAAEGTPVRGKQYIGDNGKKYFLLQDSNRFAPNPPNFYECTLGKGEMLYIPGLWWHSTLNMGETVFMSVFV